MLKLSVSISRPLHCIGGIVAIYSCHLWKDMKRYEKIWNTHYTMGESMSRQYWVHPVQVRSLELLATVEYHLYRRILFPLVRSCIPEMRSIAFQSTWYCQSILAALQEGLSWKVYDLEYHHFPCAVVLRSILSNPRPFVFINFEQSSTFLSENIWMYMKTYECIWNHVNVYENMWKTIMKVIENSATRASCHLSCWVWTNFVRMK